MKSTLLIAVSLLAAGSQAQLIISHDDTSASNTGNAYHYDFASATWTTLWSDYQAWGLAADTVNRVLYVSTGSGMGRWNFGDVGVAPTTIGTFMAGGSSAAMTGLAFANGTLYGYKSTNSTAAPAGIYSIDVGTGEATAVWVEPVTTYDLGGLEFNVADGMFYATNDGNSTTTGVLRGLYRIDVFGDGSATRIADYPTGRTDIDGLAVGNGTAYLIEDDPTGAVWSYDIAGGSYGSSLSLPFSTSEIFAGGAWAPGALNPVPEPATVLALSLAALAVARRRRTRK